MILLLLLLFLFLQPLVFITNSSFINTTSNCCDFFKKSNLFVVHSFSLVPKSSSLSLFNKRSKTFRRTTKVTTTRTSSTRIREDMRSLRLGLQSSIKPTTTTSSTKRFLFVQQQQQQQRAGVGVVVPVQVVGHQQPNVSYQTYHTRLFTTTTSSTSNSGENCDSSSTTTQPPTTTTNNNNKNNTVIQNLRRANLSFLEMDQGIEKYSKLSTGGGMKNHDETTSEITGSTSTTKGTTSSTSTNTNTTEYETWVRRLYATNLFSPVKLGLENMEQLYMEFGEPLKNKMIIHVAGTNGKGSVVFKIAKTFEMLNTDHNHKNENDNDEHERPAKLKVGMFCSPHISSFRERMQVNGQYITEEQVINLLPKIYEICQLKNIPATFFEITTMLAFLYYSMMDCQIIVLETGLGGRLDATNIISNPALSIITSIGLEHTRILGDTIELIAIEKGGIMKANCPVLVGPNVPHEVLQECGKNKQISHYYTCDDILHDERNVVNNDQGKDDYDLENSRIAKAAIKILQQSPYVQQQQQQLQLQIELLTSDMIDKGIQIRPPCRFETIQIPYYNNNDNNDNDNNDNNKDKKKKLLTVILDVAHNPPAMEYLARKLHSTYNNNNNNINNNNTTTTTKKYFFRMVVGMSSDKDIRLCYQSVLHIVNHDTNRIHFVQAAHPRAASLEDILQQTGIFDDNNNNNNNNSSSTSQVHYDLQDRSVTKQLVLAKELTIQFNKNMNQQQEEEEILIVCGSVFLMSETREALGIVEPRDSKVIAVLAGAGVRYSQENFGNTIINMQPTTTILPPPPQSQS